jgi:hypothetical protein
MRLATLGSVIAAISRIRSPQAGQRSTPISKTRFSSSAHAIRPARDPSTSARISGEAAAATVSPPASPLDARVDPISDADADADAEERAHGVSFTTAPPGTTRSRPLARGVSTP